MPPNMLLIKGTPERRDLSKRKPLGKTAAFASIALSARNGYVRGQESGFRSCARVWATGGYIKKFVSMNRHLRAPELKH